MRLMSAVPSPCIDVCRLNPVTHICAGCSRTIFEIDAWPSLSDAEKLEILQRIADSDVDQTWYIQGTLSRTGN